MPRVALSEAEVFEFREEICGVAERLFAERGYAGVTLRALAAELGCSPMTPYRYFESKEAIFAAVRSASFARFADTQEAAAASAVEPVAKLHALGQAYVRFALEEPHAYRIMFELDQAPEPDDADQLVEEIRAWQALRGAAGAAIDAAVLGGDPDILAHVYWGGLHGLVSLHLAGKLRLGRSLAELVPPMLTAVIRGTRAPIPEGDRP